MVQMRWVVFYNPEKFANANTFKANLSQKLFSNTLGQYVARAKTSLVDLEEVTIRILIIGNQYPLQ
jgi:hypothetical protein